MSTIPRLTRPARFGVLVSAAALLLTGCLGSSGDDGDQDTGRNAEAKNVELVVASNAVKGGKNSASAEFFETQVLPKFIEQQKAKGVTVKLTYQGDGSDDEVYKQKRSLDLSNKTGADVLDIDGIWVGEFAEAGYIKPLDEVVGDKGAVDGWEGWARSRRTSRSWACSRTSGTASRAAPTAG